MPGVGLGPGVCPSVSRYMSPFLDRSNLCDAINGECAPDGLQDAFEMTVPQCEGMAGANEPRLRFQTTKKPEGFNELSMQPGWNHYGVQSPNRVARTGWPRFFALSSQPSFRRALC